MTRFFLAAALLGIACTAHGAGLSYVGGVYSQDFNSLISTGSAPWVDGVTLPGWYAIHGSTPPATYDADWAGSLSGIHSFGTLGAPDRALGSSVTSWSAFGLKLVNDTGGPLDTVTVSFTGEQWDLTRFAADTLRFGVSTTATGLTDNAAFTPVPSLDFVTPVFGSPLGMDTDGNDPAHQVHLSATFNVNIAAGGFTWLRFHRPVFQDGFLGMAIDDFSVTMERTGTGVPAPSSALSGLGLIAAGIVASVARRRRVA